MLQAIAGRLLISIPVLFGVLLAGFVLLSLIPTDPAALVAGEGASPELIEKIRRDLGLDRSLAVQFLYYLERLAQGDLGRSIMNSSPVLDEILRTIGPTLELTLGAIVLALPLGIGLGLVAALRHGGLIDRAIMGLSVLGVSVPVFMTGLLLVQYLAVYARLLPSQGRGGPIWTTDGLAHLILPALTLALILLGPIARMVRTTLVEVLAQDFIRLARAKGISETRVVLRHGLRNALVPTVTLIGLQIGHLLGGAIVTETVFAWPGVGRMAVQAVMVRDTPVVQGAILGIAVVFVLVNLAVDMICAWLDPRIGAR